ncbi:type III pantothenate kinase [Marinobacter changyiensis]|uniref:type III pantothenate kinase n=1 Tax=Marinobacter changyiensis TaxID=2604091 RepID=UPI00126432B0|nr:type III pantothenate kinase [Marinobacter changyiensis]
MRLLIDAGNTRIKWRLLSGQVVMAVGYGDLTDASLFAAIKSGGQAIERVSVSTVRSDKDRKVLEGQLSGLTDAVVNFYGAEARRGELICAYPDPSKMGADRWHGMYGAWNRLHHAFAVVDAGSAITVDYVDDSGLHAGGYILPGRRLHLQSLRQDVARVGFEEPESALSNPGVNTTECVHHGLTWLWGGVVGQVQRDCRDRAISTVLVTGGDGERFIELGLVAEYRPHLVLEGLDAIDQASLT